MGAFHNTPIFSVKRCLLPIAVVTLTFLRPVLARSTTALPTGCQHNNRVYRPGEDIFRNQFGDWCYGTSCSPRGKVVRWDNFNCNSSSEVKQSECMVNGVSYKPGEEISENRTATWCFGKFCDLNGHLISWNDYDCAAESTTMQNSTESGVTARIVPVTATTDGPPPTTVSVCVYQGVTYREGEQISDGRGCGFECGANGELLPYPCTRPTSPPPTTLSVCVYQGVTYREGQQVSLGGGCGFECGPDGELIFYPCTPPPPPPSSTGRSTCLYNGIVYQEGQQIWRDGNGCGFECGSNGQVLAYPCQPPSTTPPLTTPPLTPSTPPQPPVTCEYNGATFRPGQHIPDGNGCGAFCTSDGQLVMATCTTPPLPTTIPTTPPRGCFYNGRFYAPNQVITRDSLGCGAFCTSEGQLVMATCTTPPPPTTIPTTPPRGCFYDGRFYAPNQVITRDSLGCGAFCTSDGQLVMATCTTPPPPTTISTTHPGCFYNGRFYAPNEVITRDALGCGAFCTSEGQLVMATCTTPPPPTTLPTAHTTPRGTPPANGCVYEGVTYRPGDSFGEGKSGSWCYGMSCGENGEIIHWDNFQCDGTTLPTTTSGELRGVCSVNGRVYRPGEEISRVISLNMCYGTLCDEHGDVISWEDFTCGENTGNTINPLEPVKDCVYQGQSYKPGQKILLADSRGCKVYCSLQGRVRVERFPCISPVTRTTTESSIGNRTKEVPILCIERNGTEQNSSHPVYCTSGTRQAATLSLLNVAIISFIFQAIFVNV